MTDMTCNVCVHRHQMAITCLAIIYHRKNAQNSNTNEPFYHQCETAADKFPFEIFNFEILNNDE